ncbi:unnamed protein product [Psylliodes chrysocephalus]|uniref:Uncharacterized protein n=1 Tax=Psylliodes chrysocephalus TaxID=3402493 RepID=A0A9P0D4P2_9CUCU|nr:unnamed protein product [Psylliodes chrysocephala]
MSPLKDLLKNGNSILNPSALLEDCDIVRKTTKATTKKTSIYFQKSSSGVTSLNSENSKIESNDSIRNQELALNKRQIESSSSIGQAGKKIKMDQDSVLNEQTESENSNEIFQNITNILRKDQSPDIFDEKDEFDAFANYLGQMCTPKNTKHQKALLDKNTSTCKVKNKDGDNLFSTQFLSTQDLDEIDTVVEKEIAPTAVEMQKTIGVDAIMKCFQDRLEAKEFIQESSMDREIGERSILFENEKVTTSYRHEVNQIFEKIETSICAMGGDNTVIDFDDKYFDLIFNDDMENVVETKENSPSKDTDIQNIELNNINLSFGTIIRKALIKNSTKTQLKRKNNIEALNLTIQEQTIEFRNLGPFYGLPLKVKHLVQQYKGIDELYDWQDECLKLPAIENKKNLIYALPTSGGKTLVAEILMFRELLCYRRNAIFILPYVSIVQEKVWAISPFGVALDFLVEEYASNKGVYPPRKRRRKNSIYVATIEKALGLINSLIEAGRLHELGLIVVDEFHLIGEEGRGATLEAALTKIKFLKAKIQIIGMSATIGNLPDLCQYLDAEAYTKNFRPVELIEHVKCKNNIAKINWNYKDEEDLLVDYKKVNFKYSESILKLDPDMVGGLVMEVIPEASCLIFCASKKNCENVTNLLCQISKPELKNYKNTEKEQLLHALKDESGKLCDILNNSIKYGIAYHHSGLTSDERRIIEEGFRAGIIYIICCTSTLAAGVNLPAKRVILRSPYIGRDFINLSRYKQMVGRAGRAGLGETGESILIAQPQDMPKVIQLLMSPMNKAFSSMHSCEGKGLRLANTTFFYLCIVFFCDNILIFVSGIFFSAV